MDDLSHVLWLGGSACAGKTTLARSLAARQGLALYSCDDAFEAHRRRADPRRHRHFHRLMDLPPEKLFAPPAGVQAEELLLFYRDEFEMVLEDLRELTGPVLAEGVGLLPDLVAGVAPDALEPGRSSWLIATPEFRRRACAGRDAIPGITADAFDRWMERDDLVARYLEKEARRRGLRVRIVD